MSRRFRESFEELNNGGGDDDDDDGDVNSKRKQRLFLGGCNYKKGIKRAKNVVSSPLKLFKDCKRSCLSSSITSSKLPNSSSSSKGNNSRVGKFSCCLCMSSKAQTLDTTISDEIDPNDSNGSCDDVYVKALIEKNNFYSKECNTHFVD